MNSFDKIRLDRYLTEEPPDDVTPWLEALDYTLSTFYISDSEYQKHRVAFEKWEVYLYSKGYTPGEAGKLIYKTYTRFLK